MTDASAEQRSAEQRSSAPRYDFVAIDLDSDSVHADVVRLVGRDARVLELGPATGYMSRVFVERGCEVVGIEIDAEMAAVAEEACERMIVGDLDALDPEAELGDDRFDVIVAADVLEHLRDPLAVVRKLTPFLNPGGAFVISVPNVAHGSVRLALLEGSFEYQDLGLLDSTHLHFFTRASFERLLDEAELGLAEMHRHDLNLDASEVEFDPAGISPQVVAELEGDPDARTYQFVVKALPLAQEGLREVQARLRQLVELENEVRKMEIELEGKLREMEAVKARNAELEGVIAAIGDREGELRRALIEANDQLLRRDEEFGSMHEEIRDRNEELRKSHAEAKRLNDELVAARLGLERIRQSAPFRAYAALKSMPGLRSIRRRREAVFAAEVAKRTDQSS
jgi:2-polyprenyl-3-methyl-5-hydroxy-6-metoxy-1,4-benzoquinol methylase